VSPTYSSKSNNQWAGSSYVYYDSASTQLTNRGNYYVGAFCSVVNDSYFPAGSVSAVTVYGWENSLGQSNYGSYFQACRVYHTGGGGQCGAAHYPGTNQVYALSFNPDAWNGGAMSDGYYVFAFLQAQDQYGSNNDLFSIQESY
jgi:hypothetical protein